MSDPFAIEINGTTLRGTSHGAGPALIFLHAGVADQRMWQAQLEAFSHTHRVITYDRRGFGLTEAQNKPFKHLDDVALVLDHLNIATATLCGCSQGARIAIDFALTYPRRTSALILVSALWSGAPWKEITASEIDLAKQVNAAEQAENITALNALEAHAWLDGPAADAGRVAKYQQQLFLDMNLIALNHPELTQEVEQPDTFNQYVESFLARQR